MVYKTELHLSQFRDQKLEIRVSVGPIPSEISKGDSFLASCDCRCPLACDCITPISASIFAWPSLCLCLLSSLVRTLVIGFRIHSDNSR